MRKLTLAVTLLAAPFTAKRPKRVLLPLRIDVYRRCVGDQPLSC